MVVAVTKELVTQDVIDAISFGSLYALFALGIALIFGVMRLVNFAHGELIMVGAYAIVLIGLPSPVLVPLAALIVVTLALAMERSNGARCRARPISRRASARRSPSAPLRSRSSTSSSRR